MPESPSHSDVGDQWYNEVELPSSIEIRDSSVSPGQPGAFSKSLIQKNTRFGPYKGEIIKPGQKSDIDYRYAWEIFEKRRNVLKFTISALDPKASNWMRNVNCARFYEEQNILSTQEGFSIFYVAMKDIKPGEELLTWFDPQLLKRTQRRISRSERKKVGYTIELVPWTDEKKFVPEIIETKRARKKKVLGEDMLCFEEDAALMQRSMNSMFRFPRKAESFAQPKKDYTQSSRAIIQHDVMSPKKHIIKTTPNVFNSHKKDDIKSLNTEPMPNPQRPSPVQQIHVQSEVKVEKITSNSNGAGFRSTQSAIPKQIEIVRKRRKRGRPKGNINFVGNKNTDKLATDSFGGHYSDTVNLLKPVVIRTKEGGSVEMEDHDETYRITWSPVRQECDDLCPCLDKAGFLKQVTGTSSSLHQSSQDLFARFALLPEHQIVAGNDKISYQCDICECSYNHAFSLKRHYLGIHINHRYISKDDAEFCQLETFYDGFEDKTDQGIKNCESGFDSEENKKILLKSHEPNPSAKLHTHPPAGSCSLVCNKAVVDSSAIEVPTLSSLAQTQCEKNKGLLSTLPIGNKDAMASGKAMDNSGASSVDSVCGETEQESTSGIHDPKAADEMESGKKMTGSERDSIALTDTFKNENEIPHTIGESNEGKLNCMSTSSNVDEAAKKGCDDEMRQEENSCELREGITNVALNLSSISKNREDETRTQTECLMKGHHSDIGSKSVEINKCTEGELLRADFEASQSCYPETTIGKSSTPAAHDTESKSNTATLSSPPSALPTRTANLIQTGNARPPQTPQQFLLLVPLGTASSKIPPITKVTPSTSFSIPQSQGQLPVVVFSSQVSSTSATSMQMQPSPTNRQFCPQIMTRPCHNLTSVSPSSSNLGQRFALLPHSSQHLVSSNIHSTTSTINKSQALGTRISCITTLTPPFDRKPKHSSSFPQKSLSEGKLLKKCVKLEEADQPSDLYRCHMCVLVYKTMGELKHHIKNDPHRFKGGLKQYACPKCSVRFRNKANLARHTLMHHQISDDKDRKFRCSTCGKGFTTETYLKMHARFHSGKSFPCKYGCVDAFFPNAGSLVKHLRAVHPGLNLKEYLREKKRRERIKQKLDIMKMPNMTISTPAASKVTTEYSMTNPGVGFQAKRGRPKGSKNVPKELKEMKLKRNSFEKDLIMPQSSNASGTENCSSVGMYPPVKKYYPIEKTWQKGSSFFKISSDEATNAGHSLRQRRFKCKLCGATFKSHLFLLKHRSKRHGAGQSVQEYLFEMAKEKEIESGPTTEDTFQFSPPPSPKTFFSNVNQRGADNMSKFIEGGGEMLKCRKKISFFESDMYPFSSPPQLEWTHYNFPPCFKYVRDNTTFYQGVARNENMPKVESCDFAQGTNVNSVDDKEEMILETREKAKNKHDTCDLNLESENESVVHKNESNDSADTIKEKEVSATPLCESEAKGIDTFKSDQKSDYGTRFESQNDQTESKSSKVDLDEGEEEKTTPAYSVKDKDGNDSKNASPSIFLRYDSAPSQSKGFKKSPRKSKTGMDEMTLRLNRLSMKALDLDLGFKHLNRQACSSTFSFLESLNLFSKDKLLCQKYFKRKKRERFASISACTQLLPSKFSCGSRDQWGCSKFSSPDVKDTRRFSMWQGPNSHKADTEHSSKFCCPVVESVRQQEMSKKRKEIQEKNNQEVLDIKPKDKVKEDFAASMGLLSRREYERSYHAQEKTEHCIKPPEIWDRYDRIWFGKKGAITVVCSICHRHFSCLELCLRHQLKKHPHIEPSSLEMERDNYVEDMYYYYPMPYGILAQTHLIPEKMPPPELYVCTRCRFPFKNLNKLYSHIVACDPNNCEQAPKTQSILDERNAIAIHSVTNKVVSSSITSTMPPQPQIAKPHRHRLLNSKYKNYQLFNKSGTYMSKGHPSTITQSKVSSRGPVSSTTAVSQSFMNFSSPFQRRKKNQHGLLYNPSNHTRRRELVHVLDQHQCHGCNLKFNSMSMLERHVKKCSGKDKLQNQKPLLSGVADEMMLRKQHTCRYCNKRFTFIKGVDLHYKRICAVRKIREEENQLTEEDYAHEAELQRIIEHIKWSKSLNQDSSDIIQGRVKVEEDGTLTRVEKKRGRPYGKGKRVKKKGFKWTTLKYHKQDDENSVTSNEPISSVEESLSNESLEQTVADISSKESFNPSSQDGLRREEKPPVKRDASLPPDVPKRKRGRPLKNGGRSQSISAAEPITAALPKRKRGRPPKRYQDSEVPLKYTRPVEMSLKESIDFKRGELTIENMQAKSPKLITHSTESESKAKKIVESRASHSDVIQNNSKPKADLPVAISKSLKSIKSSRVDEPRKWKVEKEITTIETIARPPARARGRPKKFDPSDMESTYKKKKKSDPGYVPLLKKNSRENLNSDLHTELEDLKTEPRSDKIVATDFGKSWKSANTIRHDARKLKESVKNSEFSREMSEPNVKTSISKERLSSGAPKHFDLNQSPKSTGSKCFKISVEKSLETGISNVKAEKRYGDSVVCATSEFVVKTSRDSIPEKKTVYEGEGPDAKKRKHISSTDNGSDIIKMSKYDKPDMADTLCYEKEITSKDKDLNENTELARPIVSVAQERHVTVTMASASANGEMVQTPVAVRIVTLPMSSLANTGPTKITNPILSSTPTQPLSPSPLVGSSPLMKLTINPHLQHTDETLLPLGEMNTTMATPVVTTTSTPSAKSPTNLVQNIPKDSSKSVLQPSALPVRQIIPMSNQSVLVPPEAIHSALAPRFIIHSSPRMASPRQRVPVPVPHAASTLTRHVSPSTVILSTGKVVSLGNHGSNLPRNPPGQHGTNLMKKVNVINPMANMSTPTQQFLPSPPHAVIQKGMGVVIDPTKSAAPGGSPPLPTAKPVYYVQTSPLSKQVVVPISTLKGGVAVSTTQNKIMLDQKDNKTITVPQLQFIPMPLVQGVDHTLNPPHAVPQQEANLGEQFSNFPNIEDSDNS